MDRRKEQILLNFIAAGQQWGIAQSIFNTAENSLVPVGDNSELLDEFTVLLSKLKQSYEDEFVKVRDEFWREFDN